MTVESIIHKLENKETLNYSELRMIFNGYLNKSINDEIMTHVLKLIYNNGLSDQEIIDLTDIFVKSGEVLDFASYGITADKHSTGGVGDKVTLILGPILASLDIKFPKMSGKGLGLTGGTIDKLESIPGINVNLTNEEIYKQISEIGISLSGQTSSLVPLDKVIYDLRNATNTVKSIPLIAVSIMCKKIACGSKLVLIDVKCGLGALIENENEANELIRIMNLIASKYNIDLLTEITPMDNPLGSNIGNALEVMEVIEILNGKENNLSELTLDLASKIISKIKNINYMDAYLLASSTIDNKTAYEKFKELINYQGGNLNELKVSSNIYNYKSLKSGIIKNIDALKIAQLVFDLGAGRKEINDNVDYGVGVIIKKNVGDYVDKDDILMDIYYTKQSNFDNEDYFVIEDDLNE